MTSNEIMSMASFEALGADPKEWVMFDQLAVAA